MDFRNNKENCIKPVFSLRNILRNTVKNHGNIHALLNIFHFRKYSTIEMKELKILDAV